MAKKKKKSKSVRQTRLRVTLIKATVDFPRPGTQNCYPANGTPFIAYGGPVPNGTVIAGAEIVLPIGIFPGVPLTAADLRDNGNGMLTGYPTHAVLPPVDTWAFAFPNFDGSGNPNDLPVLTPAAFVITTASVDGAAETVVPFQHDPNA